MKRLAKRKAKPAPMRGAGLAGQVVTAPRLSSPKLARERFADWQREIGHKPAGKALGKLIDASPKVEALLLGVADGSPFLWELIAAEPERLHALLESDPDARFAAL